MQALAIAVFTLLMLPLPYLLHSDFQLNFVIMVLFAAYLGQAWNVLGGYGGQFSFGHAAFFGTGAYATAVLQISFGVNPWVAMLGSALGGALVGLVVGFLSFRYGLRGSYFALVTLAFAEVLRLLANTFAVTGAGVGLLIPLRQSAGNFQFTERAGFFYVILALTLLSLLIAFWLERSRFGAWLIAVRENESAARALGVNAFRVKLTAITLSGTMAGIGGAFYAQMFLFIDPPLAYGPAMSVEMLLVPIIGGMGTLFGPLLGAGVLHLVGELAKSVTGKAVGLDLVLYGALLVIMVLFLPNGLFGLARSVLRRLRRPAREGGDA